MGRDDSIYDPYDRLVSIEIEGKPFEVPENNLVLRCVQFVVDDGVALSRFCWNNECGNCEFTYQTAREARPRRARGCQAIVREGMRIFELTPDLRYWLSSRLR